MLSAGGYQVSLFVLEHFRLDGGAMFGAVPKTLWSRRIQADDTNRIPLACRVALLEGNGRTVLIDCGCGDKWLPKERDIYAIEPLNPHVLDSLRDRVTDVVLTHLHFDHAGGISRRRGDGGLELTFPSARVHVQRTNWDHALNPGVRERASYLAENLEPLKAADLHLIDGDLEILPALAVRRCDGHTPGMQWIRIGRGADALVFAADLIPTSHHVPIPYVMGYDLCAATSMREKEEFLRQAHAESWRVIFEHDRDVALARIGRDAKGAFIITEQ